MAAGLYDIPVKRIDGSPASLADHKGSVMLVVNVASACGLTPQYAGLEEIYETYRDRGLVVLGFPANEFAKQEPGSNAEIKEFCETKFGVKFPMYEKMIDLDVPAMVHVSASCNPNFHATGAHYINGDTTAFMQFLTSDLFKDFPTLKFIIPHGGGGVPYHWGRYRGLAQDLKRPPLKELLLNNVFFDTCVYHQAGIDLLTKVIPVENILFASEMVGAVKGIDPETGQYFDDTKRYIDAAPGLGAGDKAKIFEANARRVFSRLDKKLSQRAA